MSKNKDARLLYGHRPLITCVSKGTGWLESTEDATSTDNIVRLGRRMLGLYPEIDVRQSAPSKYEDISYLLSSFGFRPV